MTHDTETIEVLLEFKGGRLDGQQVMKHEWPKDTAWPGTEIVDKPSGSLYRYHHPSSLRHPVYTYRAEGV